MGNNDDRYGKLEIGEKDDKKKIAIKKSNKFDRRLEIFGLPPAKNEEKKVKPEQQAKIPGEETITKDPLIKTEKKVLTKDKQRVEKFKKAQQGKEKSKAYEVYQKKLKKKFEDFEDLEKEVINDQGSIYNRGKYDDKIERNKQRNRQGKSQTVQTAEKKAEIEARQEEVGKLKKFKNKKILSILGIGGVLVMMLTGKMPAQYAMEIIAGILAIGFGIQGFGRWRNRF